MTTDISTTAATEEGGTAAQLMVVRDNQAVAIVLPIALLTIIINAAIVGVGVLLCILLNRRNKEKNVKERSHSYVNLEMSTTRSLERRDTEHTYANSDR